MENATESQTIADADAASKGENVAQATTTSAERRVKILTRIRIDATVEPRQYVLRSDVAQAGE
ncbi:hypothetical protein [Crateriforma spongiae]|uniref:hypothetical protein n=1 Tax=Crateriforma spongiae TaxID=2724528 RepID=UPI001447987A|nr:hypothetical protein [Crateriforma spongiae]